MVGSSNCHIASVIHDIGMPLYNGMWCYRQGWENRISTVTSTAKGDASTVYRFDLCSHTGTYVETSQHKLATDRLLSDFELSAFMRLCKVVSVDAKAETPIALSHFQAALVEGEITVEANDALIVATGWGMNHRDPGYVCECPFFDSKLVDWLADQQLGLLGVDTPVIDNAREPFQAVQRLFEATPEMLLMAPLVIDPTRIPTGTYFLSAAPLNVESVSGSLCRPVLMEVSE